MKITSDNFCGILDRQKTSFGNADLQLQPIHTVFTCQTYSFVYSTSNKKEQRRVNLRLQRIRHLSNYIWILVATSLTSTDLAHLHDFERCFEEIQSWNVYPIFEFLEGRVVIYYT